MVIMLLARIHLHACYSQSPLIVIVVGRMLKHNIHPSIHLSMHPSSYHHLQLDEQKKAENISSFSTWPWMMVTMDPGGFSGKEE